MSRLRVAVAGPTGFLGEAVVKHLVKAGFEVTLLSRDPSRNSKSFPTGVKWKTIQYDSKETIVASIKGQDAVVDLLNRSAWDVSVRLIDAAIEAEVPNFIPSAYGLNQKDAFVRSLPPVQGKAEMEDHLEAKAKQGLITFTAIQTSMFLDYALNNILLPLNGGTFMLFNGGTSKTSLTSFDDIGKAVTAALLKRDDEAVKNRCLFIKSVTTTQQQILQFARESNPEKIWTTFDLDTEDALKKGWEAYEQGKRDVASMRPFLIAAYGRGLGYFEKDDNEILGIEVMHEDDLREMIRKLVQ